MFHCTSRLMVATLMSILPPISQAARDGQLDTSFGVEGKAVLPFPGDLRLEPSGLTQVIVLPDGRILVAGTVINAADNNDFGIIRLDSSGMLDTTFATNGGRRIGFDRANSPMHDILVGMAIQPDGKILLSGIADGDPNTDGDDMALVRLTSSGQLDTTFGTGGRVLVPFNLGNVGNRNDNGYRIALQADGKILITGFAENASSNYLMSVARLTTSGQRDTTFDSDGRVALDFGTDYTHSIGVQIRPAANDGKIIVAGVAQGTLPNNAATSDFALARLNADGSPDGDFGEDGKTTIALDIGGNFMDLAYDVIELSDGKLMVCGSAQVNLPNNADMACIRLLADATPDPDFPPVLVPFDRGGSLNDLAAQFERDSQGRYVLVGPVNHEPGNSDFGMTRLLPDGSLDTAFGANGIMTYSSCVIVCVPGEYDNAASSMSLQPDGKIVVAGWTANNAGDYRFQVIRVLGDVIFSDDFDD